ncbi:hypothetical protein TEA_004177 [Camellia sinensis var. sinensis]|uniref:Thioredoxin domain-containing protein n=1 Tax=Camellia sinensis var. sinensis TaxID=542762 RepID=A0A4S4E399_CAMSN|nr:hypothetical protein TEA_004177 [Camellia sinensis var. sinensis]
MVVGACVRLRGEWSRVYKEGSVQRVVAAEEEPKKEAAAVAKKEAPVAVPAEVEVERKEFVDSRRRNQQLAVEYESNAIIVKVDTDDEYEFARDMQVRGLPTLYFISPDPNKDAIRTEGLIPIQMMRDVIDNQM